MVREIDPNIDAVRWIAGAEQHVSDVDCVLMGLTPKVADKGYILDNLGSVDEIGLADYLDSLAGRLRSVARRLDHIAAHGDLTDLVSSLILSDSESLEDDSVDDSSPSDGSLSNALVFLWCPPALYERMKEVERLSGQSMEDWCIEMLQTTSEVALDHYKRGDGGIPEG